MNTTVRRETERYATRGVDSSELHRVFRFVTALQPHDEFKWAMEYATRAWNLWLVGVYPEASVDRNEAVWGLWRAYSEMKKLGMVDT